jgi:hypothetical protein
LLVTDIDADAFSRLHSSGKEIETASPPAADFQYSLSLEIFLLVLVACHEVIELKTEYLILVRSVVIQRQTIFVEDGIPVVHGSPSLGNNFK